MAIRLRVVNEKYIALCAARSLPKEGDVYLHDEWHEALTNKFSRDWSDLVAGLPHDDRNDDLVDQEESNNSNRELWDLMYGENND